MPTINVRRKRRGGYKVSTRLNRKIKEEVKKDVTKELYAVPKPLGIAVLPTALSKQKKVTFKWTEGASLSTVSVGLSANQYYCNNPYGPDYTATFETQAYGWDQLVSATLYRRFMVTHFRYRVEVYKSDIKCYVGVKTHYDPTLVANNQTALHAVPSLKFRSSAVGNTSNVIIKSKWIPVDRVLGRKLDTGLDEGVYNGNPGSSPMLTVYAIDPIGTTTPAVQVLVHMEYKTNLYDRYQVSYS